MRYVNISDLLDGLEAPDLMPEARAAVSAENIKEIAMNKIRMQTEPKRRLFKRPAVAAALAAALALALGGTALAAYQGGFFHNVFGTGVSGQEAYDVEVADADGNVLKTEHYPTVERVEADEEQAEALVGAYVAAVGQSAALEGYTFTLEDVLLDKNGIGALTVHVENPDGHGLKQSGIYDGTAGERPPYGFMVERESGGLGFMDERGYPVTDSFTDTEATFVYYVTPLEPLPADEALTLRFTLWGENEKSAVIAIPAAEKIPTVNFAGEDVSASVSPVGLTLRYGFGSGAEKINDTIIIRYADGSEYAVLGDDLVNFAAASGDRDGSMSWIAFNRLADVDRIAEIFIAGRGEAGPYEYVLTR